MSKVTFAVLAIMIALFASGVVVSAGAEPVAEAPRYEASWSGHYVLPKSEPLNAWSGDYVLPKWGNE